MLSEFAQVSAHLSVANRCAMFLRYDVAILYLQQTDYNLDEAMAAYKADEKWEKEHPLEAIKKGKSKSSSVGGRSRWGGGSGGLTGQI